MEDGVGSHRACMPNHLVVCGLFNIVDNVEVWEDMDKDLRVRIIINVSGGYPAVEIRGRLKPKKCLLPNGGKRVVAIGFVDSKQPVPAFECAFGIQIWVRVAAHNELMGAVAIIVPL